MRRIKIKKPKRPGNDDIITLGGTEPEDAPVVVRPVNPAAIVQPFNVGQNPNFVRTAVNPALLPAVNPVAFNDGAVNPRFAPLPVGDPNKQFNNGAVVRPVNPVAALTDESQPQADAPMVAAKELTPLEKNRAAITDRQNKKFTDKWGILDTLKGAGLGFLQGYAATGSLGGGLGGAGVGAVQGTIDPNTDEKWSNQNHLAQLYGEEKQLVEQEKTDAAQRKLEEEAILANFKVKGEILNQQGEILNQQGKEISNARGLNDYQHERLIKHPLWQIALKNDQLTDEQAAKLNQEIGTNLPAADWRTFKEEWINGTLNTRPDKGDPGYVVNSTVDKKTLEVPRDFTVGDQTFQATSPQGLNAAVGVAQANTNREVQSAKNEQDRNDKIAENDYKTEKEYTDDVQKWQTAQVQAKAKLSGARARLEAAQTNRTELANGKYDTSEVDKQIASAKADIAEATVLMGVPKPKKVIRPKNPAAQKTASKADVQKYAKSKGISFEEAEKRAEADGYTIK